MIASVCMCLCVCFLVLCVCCAGAVRVSCACVCVCVCVCSVCVVSVSVSVSVLCVFHVYVCCVCAVSVPGGQLGGEGGKRLEGLLDRCEGRACELGVRVRFFSFRWRVLVRVRCVCNWVFYKKIEKKIVS